MKATASALRNLWQGFGIFICLYKNRRRATLHRQYYNPPMLGDGIFAGVEQPFDREAHHYADSETMAEPRFTSTRLKEL
jgi:hypothetical protein